MLDAQGRVFLMDFGLARSMELVGMTRTGALIGTPTYMSPEQARGEKADVRTDIFAFGVIFYELLTGKRPYKDEPMMATLIRRTKELATPPNQVDPSVPQSISDIVMKCLQIKTDLRYQTAEEILRDLNLILPSTIFGQPVPGVAGRPRHSPPEASSDRDIGLSLCSVKAAWARCIRPRMASSAAPLR